MCVRMCMCVCEGSVRMYVHMYVWGGGGGRSTVHNGPRDQDTGGAHQLTIITRWTWMHGSTLNKTRKS